MVVIIMKLYNKILITSTSNWRRVLE